VDVAEPELHGDRRERDERERTTFRPHSHQSATPIRTIHPALNSHDGTTAPPDEAGKRRWYSVRRDDADEGS
jgi:hypothetical protein